MTTKVFGIKETDFYNFIKKINEFYETHKVFATQSFKSDLNGTFYAVIYFESEVKK